MAGGDGVDSTRSPRRSGNVCYLRQAEVSSLSTIDRRARPSARRQSCATISSEAGRWSVRVARSPWRMRLFMKVDGRCHCGAIAYLADVEPEMASIRQRRETPAGVLRRMRYADLCVGIRKYDRPQLAARRDKATIRDSTAPADLVLLGASVDARHQNSALFAQRVTSRSKKLRAFGA